MSYSNLKPTPQIQCIPLKASIADGLIEQFAKNKPHISFSPFNAKIMLNFIHQSLDIIKATVNRANPLDVKKVMSEYISKPGATIAGLTVLHIGALNSDPEVLEYLVMVAQSHKIDLSQLLQIHSPHPLVEILKTKDEGKSKYVQFYHNWTPLNIAIDQEDVQKIQFLQHSGLSQISLKSYANDIRGSIFGCSIDVLQKNKSKGDLIPEYSQEQLGNSKFIKARTDLCDLALELQNWGDIFNYKSTDSLQEKNSRIKESHILRHLTNNSWITFYSEKLANDDEFKNFIAPAFLDTFVDYIELNQANGLSSNSFSSMEAFFTFFPQGLIKNQELWKPKEIEVIAKKIAEVEGACLKIPQLGLALKQQLQEARKLCIVLEKKILDKSIAYKQIQEKDNLERGNSQADRQNKKHKI